MTELVPRTTLSPQVFVDEIWDKVTCYLGRIKVSRASGLTVLSTLHKQDDSSSKALNARFSILRKVKCCQVKEKVAAQFQIELSFE